MLAKLADLAHGRPRRVLAIAFVIAIAAGAFGGSVADRLLPFEADDPASESIRASEQLEDATGVDPDAGIVALVDTPGPVDSRAGRQRVEEVVRDLRGLPQVGAVRSVLDGNDPALVSENGRATYVTAQLRADADEDDAAEAAEQRFEYLPDVALGGVAIAETEVGETVESDLARAELFAFPLLFLLSLLFFRSVVSALLPLLVGGLAILGTFVVLRIASEGVDISIFALNLTTGLGLGLGIDYSLFIVSRYREEIERVGAGREALRNTMATAGRTVLFSSLTVAAALAALLTFPQRFLYSMGIGGMSVALIAAVIALVVLPAVLALLGERVNALAPKRLQRAAHRDAQPAAAGPWYRLSRFVMRRPGRIATASAVLLIALGIPFLGVNFVSVDASILPAGSEPRVVDERLASEFPPNRTEPIELVTAGASRQQLAAYADRIAAVEGITAVAPPQSLAAGETAVVRAVIEPDTVSQAAQDLVRDVRALAPPFEALVGGRSAEFVDQKASLADHVPLALLIVFGATIVVMFLMTGSVVLPLKAAVMNLLTISATFGALVLIFQDGRLEGLLGYTSQGGLDTTQPLFLAMVAFGLSTDYAVFLLSRIKEARDAGATNGEAVAIGLERTGRIVTAAALLFSVAIGAFVTSDIVFIKQLGLGTAIAVLIDATIVRALLVPSLMELLGQRNWWSPRPLRRLHARIGLRERPAASQA